MRKTKFLFLALAVLTALLATTILPVFAPPAPEPRPRPPTGSGRVTFYDNAFGVNAQVAFRVADNNVIGQKDKITFRYSNDAGGSYALGLPTGISPWNEGTNLLASVAYYITPNSFAVVGKVIATKGSGMPALDTLVLFVFSDSGLKGGDGDYVQMWYGAGITWTPLQMGYPPVPAWEITSGNIMISAEAP